MVHGRGFANRRSLRSASSGSPRVAEKIPLRISLHVFQFRFSRASPRMSGSAATGPLQKMDRPSRSGRAPECAWRPQGRMTISVCRWAFDGLMPWASVPTLWEVAASGSSLSG